MTRWRLNTVHLALLIGCVGPQENETSMNDYRIERPSTDVDLAWLVIEPMWKAVDIYQDESTLEQTLAGATPGQRAVHACSWYRSEVNNGGHDQFFFNSTGILWEEALRGFRLIGANEYAQVLESAVSLFPASRPSKDRDQRISQLEQLDRSVLDDLDDRFYSLEERAALDDLFLAYIAEHRREFFVE